MLRFLGKMAYDSIAVGNISKGFFYGADALYLPMFYKDLFSGYSLRGWTPPPSPYYFPDMALYSLINFLVRDFDLAIMGYGIIQSLLFILALIYLSNTIFPKKRSIHAFILFYPS